MRIISGIKKGKKLSLPDPKCTRPLRDQVKENIFNILIHQKKFETEILNSIVVDFFSGSGSFGIECLSRQSKKVYFIESNTKIQNTLYRNLSNNFDENSYQIIKSNFFNIDKKKLISEIKPNIIFLDPPYDIENFDQIFSFIDSLKKTNILIILHIHKNKNVFFKGFKKNLERECGISKIIFLKN